MKHGKNGKVSLGVNMQLINYAKSLDSSQDVISWLETSATSALKKDKIKEHEIEHIIDWMCSADAPKRLLKMSVVDAKRKAHEWSEKSKKKGKDIKESEDDVSDFMTFDDGFRIVELLTKKSYQREGALMSHCLGGYTVKKNVSMYSLRDKKNQPHCTFEISKNGEEVLQIKGKGNGSIHPKYVYKVIAFLENNGMKIRPSEMTNLGYHHIPKKHIGFIKKFKNLDCKIVDIFDEAYAF